jgi:hypothetical protein
MYGNKIKSIKGWQLTTETWHEVEANYFADCSGDSILAPLSGAEFRYGREASSEFGESIAPEKADDRTMGMSCLIQARETSEPQKFIPPEWAYKYKSDNDLPNRHHALEKYGNFWWLEIGGEADSIHDAEKNRDELLKIAFGVWDHMKNHGDHEADNWVLDWVGFLPGKRESRRYVGDHILTQNDVRSEGRFDDMVAYGGWPMDDHHPAGFNYPGKPTIFHEAPSPFGIPYRCLYSKNIDNLFFAGRNISATHAAMSSTRVMATCSTLGQAVGTAAAIAAKNNLSPRGIYESKINELKETLMDGDCYLPWNKRQVSELTLKAEMTSSTGTPEALRNGIDRPVGDDSNAWEAKAGDSVEFKFKKIEKINGMRFIFDSNLNRRILNMPCSQPLKKEKFQPPSTLVSDIKVEALNKNGSWAEEARVENNHQRLVRLDMNIDSEALRVVVQKTCGNETIKIFAVDIL